MGYGVMVTLQILVLSFLVRIQVAQLKRPSFGGRFFVLGGYLQVVVVPTMRVFIMVFQMQASNAIINTPQ